MEEEVAMGEEVAMEEQEFRGKSRSLETLEKLLSREEQTESKELVEKIPIENTNSNKSFQSSPLKGTALPKGNCIIINNTNDNIWVFKYIL